MYKKQVGVPILLSESEKTINNRSYLKIDAIKKTINSCFNRENGIKPNGPYFFGAKKPKVG